MRNTRDASAVDSAHWAVLHFTEKLYSFKKMQGSNPNIVEELRQRSVDTYLAANTAEARTNSQKFGEAATAIDRLSVETRAFVLAHPCNERGRNNYFYPRLSKCVTPFELPMHSVAEIVLLR